MAKKLFDGQSLDVRYAREMKIMKRVSCKFLASSVVLASVIVFGAAGVRAGTDNDVPVEQVASQIQILKPVAEPGQSATQLPDGRWLLLGGRDSKNKVTGQATLLNPASLQSVTLSQGLRTPRTHHTATVLPDGTVLIVGGTDQAGNPLADVERYRSDTQRFESLGDLGLTPRTQHTATLLMDGRLLIAGGIDATSYVHADAQLLDTKTLKVEALSPSMDSARFDHLAALLPSDFVLLWKGQDHTRQPVTAGELYNRTTAKFSALKKAPAGALPTKSYRETAPLVQAYLPPSGSTQVPVDTKVAVRFNKPLRPETLNSQTLTLMGPSGPVDSLVVPAENGLLAFVSPKQQLLPATRYTIFAQGATDAENRTIPFGASYFNTANLGVNSTPTSLSSRAGVAGGSSAANDGERWIPQINGPHGWRSNGADQGLQSPAKRDVLARALYGKKPGKNSLPSAAPGVTALAGQVLRLNGKPLSGVKLSIGNQPIFTDNNGEFLLQSIPSGKQTLVIDATTADQGGHRYGRYEYLATIEQGKTTALPFVIWMTALDTKDAVEVPAPTTGETVITNPEIPGLELRIPAGTVIRDDAGNNVTRISMTAIPIDQPPFPLPNFPVPVYFTVQPGGAHLQAMNAQAAQGARLIYPNFSKAAPGTRVDFWNYDAHDKSWYIYGQGSVTADGKQVMPDPGVVIYEFTGAMIAQPSTAPAEGPPPSEPPPDDPTTCESGPAQEGDPVDCFTGLFLHRRADLQVNDVVPVSVGRTYRTRDTVSRAFGIGANLSYDFFLVGDTFPYTYQELILPDGARVRFIRTSTGTSYNDAAYVNTSTPGRFFGATLRWDESMPGNVWSLRLRDGTTFFFPDSYQSTVARCAAAKMIRDRFGNTVTLTRDSNCNLTRVTSPNGRGINFTYDGSKRITQAKDDIGRTVIYAYDTSGRLASVTDPLNQVESYTYDSSHRMLTVTDKRNNVMVTNTYDGNGRVATQTYADNTGSSFVYTLDGSGKVIQTDYTDERGVVKRVQFNSAGYPATTIRAVGKPEEQTVTFTRDAGNQVQSKTDAMGRVTTYQYDAIGNVLQETQLAGTANAVSWGYTYEPNFNQVSTITDPLSHMTSYSYDYLGRMTQVKDPLNNVVSFGYNVAGQPISMTRTAGSTQLTYTMSYSGGDLASVSDPLSRATQYFVDGVGRVVGVRDAQGNLQQIVYDKLDRVTSTIDALGQVVQQGYDANNNLTSFTDGNSHATQFTYDTRNRLSSKTDPLTRAESYQYDAIGNLSRVTDRKGQVTGYGYDFLNRRTSAGFGATVASPTAYISTIAYGWDAGDRLTSATDSVSGTVTRSFDDLDRLIQEQTPQGQVGYTYYANGLRQTMTVQGQAAVGYTYDNANRLTQIAQSGATVGFTYDSANRRTTLTLPNGVQVIYGYDNASELTSLTYQKGATTLGNLTYGYDAAGQRNAMGGSLAQTSLPSAVTGVTVDTANQLTGWAGASISYDANGAMTAKGGVGYEWDERQRLVQVKSGSTITAGFSYDAFNRRIGKTVGGAATSFLHDGWQIVQELSGTTPKANLLTGLGLDQIYRRVEGGAVNDYLTDALGSTIALTDSTGAIQAGYTYDPYGATAASGVSNANAYQYTGRENDEVGVYYYRNRYYSPEMGRFLSEDPLGFAAGQNLHAYVAGNPISRVDPTGQNAAVITVGVPIVVASAAFCALVPSHPSCVAARKLIKACIDSMSRDKDDGEEPCENEIRHCEQICRDSSSDPDRKNVWAGSRSACMKGCVSSRCGGGR